MTDKEFLLSKLYDNTVCYQINEKEIWFTNQKNCYLSNFYLKSNDFYLSYQRIWWDVKSKFGDNDQGTRGLISSILEEHLKRKGLKTGFWI